MRRDITRLALLASAGLAVSYIEFLLTPSLGVPGLKLGLANIATLVALYMYGAGRAALVCVARVALAGFLFGSLSSLMYALSGAIAALCVMAAVKKSGWFSIIGVSCAGGVAHNAAQLALAAIIAKTPGLMYYAPVLAIFGVVAGAAMGYLSGTLIKRVK